METMSVADAMEDMPIHANANSFITDAPLIFAAQ
jgi:hypothetical protein